MKPKEIDLGFRIDDTKLWDLDIPTEEIPISDLEFNFDIPYLEKEGTDDWNLSISELIRDFDKENTHAKRVKGVDLSFPIHVYNLNGNWIILDGVHRVAKALLEGHKTIEVRRVTAEQLNRARVGKL